jgi:hypothetical protein
MTTASIASSRRLLWAALALTGSAAFACSFSYSSESLSDSSRSSSDSSRSSAGGDHAAFRADVEQYTAAYVQGGGQRETAFFAGLGDLARRRGVSDWEAEPATWEAIGAGLARGDVSDAQRRAYEAAWAEGDADRASAIERGYAEAR